MLVEKIINCINIIFVLSFPPYWPLKICVCLPRKYGRFMLLIDNNLLLQVQNYIYWIISTENGHRHHHKFIKYEKRLRKIGNMLGLPIKQKSLPLQREIWCVALPWVRSSDPTDSLHISCICSIWKILHFFSSLSLNPSKSAFFHVFTFSFGMLFIVYKQWARYRRVHIEDHMNKFEFLSSRTIITITIVVGLFCQKIVSFAA